MLCLLISDSGAAQTTPPARTTKAETPRKHPIPSAAQQAAAAKKLAGVLDNIPSGPTQLEQQALAQKLYKLAGQNKADAAARYVLLDRAAEHGARSGDLGTMLVALSDLEAGYEKDWLTYRLEKLKQAGPTTVLHSHFRRLTHACFKMIDEANAANSYDRSLELLGELGKWAKQRNDKELAARVGERVAESQEWRRAYEGCSKARTVLKTKPDDPAAHLAVGRYLAFYQGNWKEGIPHLAKCADPALKKLGELEAARTAPQALKLTEGWAAYAQKQSAALRKHLHKRAGHWYLKAKKDLPAAKRMALEDRFAKLELILASLELNALKNWQIKKGKWQMTGDGKIRGSGDTTIQFRRNLPPDFYLQFRIKVVSGLRPRMHFQGTAMFVGNEGFKQELWTHEAVETRGTKRPYVNGEEMLIGIWFVGKSFEWYVDGELMARGRRKVVPRRIALAFRAGDDWSKGTTEYWDFKIAPKKPTEAPVPGKTPTTAATRKAR